MTRTQEKIIELENTYKVMFDILKLKMNKKQKQELLEVFEKLLGFQMRHLNSTVLHSIHYPSLHK